MPRTKIETGQTWYNKTAHYPVKVINTLKRDILVKDERLNFAATGGHKYMTRAELHKDYRVNQ